MALWWDQLFSMEYSAGAAASRQQTGGHLINLSRRPASSWDALLTQCRWWERVGWWRSCHCCWCRSPTLCRSVSQHLAAPSATDWYTLSVWRRGIACPSPSCCCQTVQPALLPVYLTLYSALFNMSVQNLFIFLHYLVNFLNTHIYILFRFQICVYRVAVNYALYHVNMYIHLFYLFPF